MKRAKAKEFRGVKAPRLRFDRTAVGLVERLQAALAKSVPDGKTVVVTITAPIRQDSKTGGILIDRIREFLVTGQVQLRATICENRIRVCVLEGGGSYTSKLLGFVHNPEPNPEVLFDVTRSLLACIRSHKRPPKGERWLITANKDGLAHIETVRQVSLALRGQTHRAAVQ
jgi:hypothetical protein